MRYPGPWWTRFAVGTIVIGTAVSFLPSTSAAEPQEFLRSPDAGSPVFAGDEVIFRDDALHRLTIKASPLGGPARLLKTFQGDQDCCSYNRSVVHRASATAIAVLDSYNTGNTGPDQTGHRRLEAGPLEGPHEVLVDCRSPQDAPALGYARYPFDVSEDRIAYVTDTCGDGSPQVRIVVRKLGGGGGVEIASLPQQEVMRPVGVRIAGRFVAFRRPGPPGCRCREIVVHDVDSGAEAYRIADDGSFDVQSDGKVAVGRPSLSSTGCSGNIAWYSPVDSTPHEIPGCANGGLVIANDRIAFGRRVSDYKGEDSSTIALTGLAGATRDVRVSAPYQGTAGFDFDGSRLIYAVDGCGHELLYLDDLSGDALSVGPTPCRVRISGGRVGVSRGEARIKLTCPRGCDGSLRLERVGAEWGASYFSTFSREAPGSFRVPLKLKPSFRRLLARYGSVKAVVRVQADQPAGSLYPSKTVTVLSR